MKTVIMAGGRGTRISKVIQDVPKPLIPIYGKPILEREIEMLASQGFNDIVITVSYLADKIIEYFNDGRKWGVNIEYFVEEEPLGNAGALFKMRDNLGEVFILINADSMFDVDLKRMLEFHKKKKSVVTLFTHPNSHPYDSGLIISNKNKSVLQWLTKEDERPQYYKNRVNAGLHIINTEILYDVNIDISNIGKFDYITNKVYKVDLDRHVLKPLAGTGKMFCYDSPEYVKDMGTPERYESVNSDYSRGIVSKKNLLKKQKAIFLDRDGTINKYVGFLNNINDFELEEGISDAIKKINEAGYLCIVITNQPVIARGELTIGELEEIHNKMETLLGLDGAYLDAIYYCPHHPHKGYEGEIAELKIECDCRKPKPGMLLKAAADYNIDLHNSYMIGDGENDIIAGKIAGCKTVLLDNGNRQFGQNITKKSVKEFVEDYI